MCIIYIHRERERESCFKELAHATRGLQVQNLEGGLETQGSFEAAAGVQKQPPLCASVRRPPLRRPQSSWIGPMCMALSWLISSSKAPDPNVVPSGAPRDSDSVQGSGGTTQPWHIFTSRRTGKPTPPGRGPRVKAETPPFRGNSREQLSDLRGKDIF